MTTKQIDKIVQELKSFPENKIDSLLDYLYFLKQEEEEQNIMVEAEEEISKGKGINWRAVKRDV